MSTLSGIRDQLQRATQTHQNEETCDFKTHISFFLPHLFRINIMYFKTGEQQSTCNQFK